MDDRVFIKDLLVRGIIGVNDWERKEAQDILINIEIACDIREAAADDDLEKSVNYRTIAKKVIGYAQESQPLTVEKLAEDIAVICLEEERAVFATVRVEKPGAVRFASSVGVEIRRSK